MSFGWRRPYLIEEDFDAGVETDASNGTVPFGRLRVEIDEDGEMLDDGVVDRQAQFAVLRLESIASIEKALMQMGKEILGQKSIDQRRIRAEDEDTEQAACLHGRGFVLVRNARLSYLREDKRRMTNGVYLRWRSERERERKHTEAAQSSTSATLHFLCW